MLIGEHRDHSKGQGGDTVEQGGGAGGGLLKKPPGNKVDQDHSTGSGQTVDQLDCHWAAPNPEQKPLKDHLTGLTRPVLKVSPGLKAVVAIPKQLGGLQKYSKI